MPLWWPQEPAFAVSQATTGYRVWNVRLDPKDKQKPIRILAKAGTDIVAIERAGGTHLPFHLVSSDGDKTVYESNGPVGAPLLKIKTTGSSEPVIVEIIEPVTEAR